ncbi:arf-GAP with dual PH domain-containing protein 2 [Danio aesculapii]|uniref:arf-GAP with dual PH domain-containing protein 2 n=1 Tax=Danio aesculapii TaxID=1142201 RepID=UPI0024C02DEA|nr:arf-GAP with dual PH domain-containing protein 2 [Danio aesculapii]
MTDNERAARNLKHVLQKPGNGSCADCGADNPEWGSCSLGVFICLACSGVHRSIPTIGKVKSLRLSRWEDSEVQFLSECGNDLMKAVYEAAVPVYYYKPTHRDCQVLKEQWIRAKYERQEFTEVGKKLIYEDGTGEIVDWFNSIRAAQLHYLKVAFPGATDAELKPKLTRSFLKEGYMEKTGPRQTEGFKKRWFTLDHRRLMYFKDPLDAFAKGEVFLGHRDHGYRVTIGLPAGSHCNGAWQFGITIETPERSFLFTCETDTEQKDWMSQFNTLICTPMSPQEYSVEAYFKHKH